MVTWLVDHTYPVLNVVVFKDLSPSGFYYNRAPHSRSQPKKMEDS